MAERDDKRQERPAEATPAEEPSGLPGSPSSPSTPTSLFQAFGELALMFGKWCEGWAPLGRRLAELINSLEQLFAPFGRAIQAIVQSPEMKQIAEAVATWKQVQEGAAYYCIPYNLELKRLGLKPFSKEKYLSIVIFSHLLSDAKERQLGRRPPLEEVALLVGRPDVTAALVMERVKLRRSIDNLEKVNKQEEGDLVTTAYLKLVEEIIPRIQRHLKEVPMTDFRRVVQPMLAEVLQDAYLVTSIKRELVRHLKRELRQKEKDEEWLAESMAKEKQRLTDPNIDREQAWVIEQAMASFLERPRVGELDRKMVAELRRSPDSSAREIAGRIGEPVRTVQYHRRKLREYVRKEAEI
ncbi:MAG: hypothetical protein GTN65_08105 [Armatimonadetes bacterium]|nr:hypothetical protein [Armatimonadota bacterium]NIO97047.1 hypothetical protein [Armatimonadota bacterium]